MEFDVCVFVVLTTASMTTTTMLFDCYEKYVHGSGQSTSTPITLRLEGFLA